MTKTVGVRELKNQASRVIREVVEEKAEYVVTLRGEPLALLRPLTREETASLQRGEQQEALKEMRALAGRVGAAWTSDKTAVELVGEQRR